MAIRVATLDDMPRILVLGEQMHQESPRWSRLAFNRAKAANLIAQLIMTPDGAVFLAECDGVIVGGIAGAVSPHWASDDLVGNEISLFIAPAARGNMTAVRLVSAFRTWAGRRGAKWLHAGTSTGVDPERTAAFYEALGFSRCSIGLEYTYA